MNIHFQKYTFLLIFMPDHIFIISCSFFSYLQNILCCRFTWFQLVLSGTFINIVHSSIKMIALLTIISVGVKTLLFRLLYMLLLWSRTGCKLPSNEYTLSRHFTKSSVSYSTSLQVSIIQVSFSTPAKVFGSFFSVFQNKSSKASRVDTLSGHGKIDSFTTWRCEKYSLRCLPATVKRA